MTEAITPIVFGNEFSCEFSFEFCDKGLISPQKIKIVSNEYNDNNQLLKLLQNQLNILRHISPVPPPTRGTIESTITEKSNNKLAILQSRLNRLHAATTPMMFANTNGIMTVTTTIKSDNKLTQLQSQLEHLHNIPLVEDAAICQCYGCRR